MLRRFLSRRGFAALWLLAIPPLLVAIATPDLLVLNSRPGHVPLDDDRRAALAAAAARPRPPAHPDTAPALLESYASRPLPDWREQSKVTAPRALIARLALGRDIPEVNAYLLAARPTALTGSTSVLGKGDYDFTLVPLTAMLHLFGDRPDRLHPETVRHLLDTLLVLEGGTPRLTVPRTLGRVYDTENHLLMSESSRYLKNQWLRAAGSADPRHDNAANGLRDWLAGYLNHLVEDGFHEFHSVPYEGYALDPILNLHAFAEDGDIRHLATALLDRAAWEYALGSLGFRQCVPHRRQMKYAGDPGLRINSLHGVARVWGATPASPITDEVTRAHQALLAALLPYRPPADTLAWMRGAPRHYFARVGHRHDGSPCLHSGGPGYLLSAGGTARGWWRRVVPRPTLLLLDDGATNLADCLHLPGAGHWTRWNNTGVHARFACGPRPPAVPASWTPAAEGGGWRVYTPPTAHGLHVAVHAADDAGIIALFPDQIRGAEETLAAVRQANPDPARLRRAYTWPGGPTLEYDLRARGGTWVMARVDGAPLDRNHGGWPPDPVIE